MFFGDQDEEEQYPVTGTLEDKAVFSLEQARRGFWWAKKNYLDCREGGSRHTATMRAFGAKSAETMAKHAEMNFKGFCANAMLTEDGETTDPKYSTEKMINGELRRIRSMIILNASQYMTHFESMMPEDVMQWTYDAVYFNLFPFVERYVNEAFEQINIVIPGRKMKPRSAAELENHIDELAKKYGDVKNRVGFQSQYLIHQIRDSVIEFLLMELPFNNSRLEKKDELVPAPAPETVPGSEEPKKILH